MDISNLTYEELIALEKEVVKRRTEFDLAHAKARYHIVEGLIKCISILDEVIKTIRASKNKSDAKDNLVKEYFANVDKYENASDYAENMYQVLKGVVTIEEIFNAIVNAQASKKYETYNDNFLK